MLRGVFKALVNRRGPSCIEHGRKASEGPIEGFEGVKEHADSKGPARASGGQRAEALSQGGFVTGKRLLKAL